jgi:ATP-dependent protease HslVU (ClpYQ) peptidase subunit
MTCIVGLVHDGVTYIGGDSLGSNGYSKVARKDKKVFKLKDTDNAIVGFTSSFRMGQLLMYENGLIDKRDEPNIDHEYLVTKFIPRLISTFEYGGYGKNNSGDKSGGIFLLGYKDRLYKIESDFQVGESFNNYQACGCGEDFALGSLYATEDSKLSPTERIRLALQAASKFSAGVAPPYYIVNTEDSKVVEFKD